MLAWEGLLQHCDHADVKSAVFWSLSECQILLVLLRTGCCGILPKLWSGPGPCSCNLAAPWISPLDCFPLPESGFDTLFFVWKGVLQTLIIWSITILTNGRSLRGFPKVYTSAISSFSFITIKYNISRPLTPSAVSVNLKCCWLKNLSSLEPT